LFGLRRNAQVWLTRAFTTAFAATVVALFAFNGSANADSYTYCSGCTINGGGVYECPYWAYITLDYVHRLSGSSATIGAIAQYADDGSWGNWATSTATEVTHSYSGGRPAWGAAGNFGRGNYGFNAHVNY
jgi:hypothetical protein